MGWSEVNSKQLKVWSATAGCAAVAAITTTPSTIPPTAEQH
jgi:hypothetical protein